nr:uracil-DNA glycosylase [Clostridium acetireducens]
MKELENLKNKIENICHNYKDDNIGGWITGDGPVPCNLLFIGEAPGKTEVEERKPFVGKAGESFEKYLKYIGLNRKNVRITNTCFFRPIKIKTNKFGKKTVSNRTPKVKEINLFKNILNEEIELVNPKIIVTLGNIPLKQMTNFKSIGECHGNLYFNEILNVNIFPMYHPSSLNYNNNETFIKTYKEDWIKLKKVLDKII